MIVYDDNTTQSRTVCYSKLDLGDRESHDTIGAASVIICLTLLQTGNMDVALTHKIAGRTPHIGECAYSTGHGYASPVDVQNLRAGAHQKSRFPWGLYRNDAQNLPKMQESPRLI